MSKPSIESKTTLQWPKKLLFAAITTIGFFLLVEVGLALVGYQPSTVTSDPLLGFSRQIPLLESVSDDDGSVTLQTAPGKLVWFNPQSFPAVKPAGTRRVFCVGGSTTYGRPYSDLTSYCAWLRELLPLADPSVDWEVINVGGISYASYRVAEVMQELVNHDPDLFLVYSAHNEFLERRTYQGMFESSRLGRDVSATLQKTRTGSLMRSAISWAFPASSSSTERLPEEVDEMLNHSIGPRDYRRDDAWQAKVLHHYHWNLQRMVSIAREAGAEIVFITPASNLRDCWPFKTGFRSESGGDTAAKTRRQLERILSMLEEERFAEAMADCEVLLKADNRNAEAHFYAGRALFGLERFDEAETAFQRAIDEDLCPLRATTQISEAIKRVAGENQVALVDFEHQLQLRCRRELGHRCFGRESFLDHVHPTIDVHRNLALWILARLQSESLVAGSLPAASDIDRVRQRIESQIDTQAEGIAFRNLAKVLHWAGKFHQAAAHAADATRLLPADLESRFLLAECLSRLGRRDEALLQYEELFDRGDYPRGYVSFAELLMEQGRWREAKSYLIPAVLTDEPQRERALYSLGIVHLRLGEHEFALECFRKLHHSYQDEPDVLLLRAEAAMGMADVEAGIEFLRKLIELDPENFEGYYRIAVALISQNRTADARRHLEIARRIDPSDVRLSPAFAVIRGLERKPTE